ncbi:MAG: hypothetical protein ACJAY2_002959, partial [Pseudomonadales bacterium]
PTRMGSSEAHPVKNPPEMPIPAVAIASMRKNLSIIGKV